MSFSSIWFLFFFLSLFSVTLMPTCFNLTSSCIKHFIQFHLFWSSFSTSSYFYVLYCSAALIWSLKLNRFCPLWSKLVPLITMLLLHCTNAKLTWSGPYINSTLMIKPFTWSPFMPTWMMYLKIVHFFHLIICLFLTMLMQCKQTCFMK